MRKKYGNGGKSLTKEQKTLPPALQKLIKGKKKKEKKPSIMMASMKGKK